MQNISASVVVHINESLSEEEFHDLESDMMASPGVSTTSVNERIPHLMIVEYDPGKTQSCHLINEVKQHGYHAQLIGWL